MYFVNCSWKYLVFLKCCSFPIAIMIDFLSLTLFFSMYFDLKCKNLQVRGFIIDTYYATID